LQPSGCKGDVLRCRIYCERCPNRSERQPGLAFACHWGCGTAFLPWPAFHSGVSHSIWL